MHAGYHERLGGFMQMIRFYSAFLGIASVELRFYRAHPNPARPTILSPALQGTAPATPHAGKRAMARQVRVSYIAASVIGASDFQHTAFAD